MPTKLIAATLTASLLVAACGGSEPAPKTAAAPSSPSASAPASASAAPPPAAVNPPAAVPVASGLERRFARLETKNDAIALAIDVPAEWSLEPAKRDLTVSPCHTEGPFSKLSVVALACDGLESCTSKRYDAAALAAARRESPTATRAWIIQDRDVHGHRQIDAELLVSGAGASVVSCHVMGLAGADLALFDRYKAACDTLTLAPVDMPPAVSAPQPARPSSEDLAAPSSSRDKALTDTALAFVNASAKRDLKAARAVIMGLGSGGCPATVRDRARCQRDLDRMSAVLPKVLESVPADFEASWVELRRDTPVKGITGAMVHSKANACGDGVGVMMLETPDGKPWVSFAFKKDDAK